MTVRHSDTKSRWHSGIARNCIEANRLQGVVGVGDIVAECFERIGVTAAKLTELAVIAEQKTTI